MNLCILDCETTGVDVANDRIIQFAAVRNDREPLNCLVYPCRKIPTEVTKLTGITDAAVAAAPPFIAVAATIAEYMSGVDALVGFGCANFDVPLLAEEFIRAGVDFDWSSVEIIDVGVLFKVMEPRTLSAAVRFYCDREHDGAHDAMNDVIATYAVFSAQMDRYPTLSGLSVAELAAKSRYEGQAKPADPAGKLIWVDGKICFGTQRNKGVPVVDDPGYAEWMCRQDFIPEATKRLIGKVFDQQRSLYNAAQDAGDSGEMPF